LRPTMGRWWGSSRHRISPGGCAVGERSTAERSTADRTAGTWTGGTEVDCFTHYGLGGFPAGLGSPDRAIVRQLYLLVPGAFSELASWARVTRNARCADASLDADQWFPVSVEADRARQEAAAAIAICSTCMVRAQCLALSLRDLGYRPAWCLGRPGRSRTSGLAPQDIGERHPPGAPRSSRVPGS
jgi:hypothetical protein